MTEVPMPVLIIRQLHMNLTLYGATSNYDRIQTLEKSYDNSSNRKP